MAKAGLALVRGREGPAPAVARAGLALPRGLLADLAAAARAGRLTPELPGTLYQARLARVDRRAAGIYYTPARLVALAVARTLGGPGRSTSAAVLDPACGAGAFLCAALAALEDTASAGGARRGPALRARLVRRLTGIDRDPVAADLCRLSLAIAIAGDAALVDPEPLAAATPRIRVADALASAPPSADVVLGNPPWGQKDFALDARERARLRAEFTTCARGVIDPFAPFVELAHRALAPGGRWALVLPDVVLLKNQPAVRRLMLEGSALELVAHAGRAFPGVNLDAVVIVGRRVAALPAGHAVEAWDVVPEAGRPSAGARRRIPQRVFAEQPGQVLNLRLDAPARAALGALAALPRLCDAFEIHEGVHSGNARAKLFVAARPKVGAPIIVGGAELARHRLRWAGRWLDRDPRAIDRAAGDYANLGRPEWFARPKILVRRTGDRIIAAFDGVGHTVSNNLFVVLPRRPDASEDELLAWTAILSARFMTAHFRAVVPRVGRLFAELKIHHLAAFPAPPPARLASALPRLAALARSRVAAAERDDAAAGEALDRTIDEVVDGLYPQAARRR